MCQLFVSHVAAVPEIPAAGVHALRRTSPRSAQQGRSSGRKDSGQRAARPRAQSMDGTRPPVDTRAFPEVSALHRADLPAAVFLGAVKEVKHVQTHLVQRSALLQLKTALSMEPKPHRVSGVVLR